MDAEGAGSLSVVWCKSTDLEPQTGASGLRFGQEQNEFLWPCEAQASSSSNRRVCLLILRLEPVTFKWQVELCALEGAAASEKDTQGLSCLWSNELFWPRLLLFFSASHLARLLETLLDWQSQFWETNQTWALHKDDLKRDLWIIYLVFWRSSKSSNDELCLNMSDVTLLCYSFYWTQ